MKALVLAVLTNMNFTQYDAVCEMTDENSVGQIGFEMSKPPITKLIDKINAGEFNVEQFKDLPGLVFYQRDLNEFIAMIKPTWSTVSPQYKANERRMAKGCMIDGFKYDMYVGWMDSFATTRGKPFVRMPREMYNLEMDKLSK